MDPDRIAELLTPFFETPAAESETLSARQLDQISIYIDLLLRWNARINLTAIRNPEEIVTRHFGESLFAARFLLPCDAGTLARVPPAVEGPSKTGMTDVLPVGLYAEVRDQQNVPQTSIPDADQGGTPPVAPHSKQLGSVVDLGSGAGFPGLPIKIWSPHTPVTLVESNQKKVAFLREVIRALTLTDINVFPRRAEDYPAASASLLTLRAVERFEVILPAAARLVFPGGSLALLIGQSQVAQPQTLLPTFQWRNPFPIPLSTSRVLIHGTRAQEA